MLVLVQVSSMKTSRLKVDEALIGSPSFAVAADVWAILLACDKGLFDRDADPAKEAAHHRGVGFDPSLGRKAIAEGLKRDVRFLGPRGLQKVPVRHQLGSPVAAVPDRLSRAVPFNPLKPFEVATDSLIS